MLLVTYFSLQRKYILSCAIILFLKQFLKNHGYVSTTLQLSQQIISQYVTHISFKMQQCCFPPELSLGLGACMMSPPLLGNFLNFSFFDRNRKKLRGKTNTCSTAAPFMKLPHLQVGRGGLNPGPCTWCQGCSTGCTPSSSKMQLKVKSKP